MTLTKLLTIRLLLALAIAFFFNGCIKTNTNLADKVMVIAHKGYHVVEHENTLESFEAAYSNDFKNIEFDIHFSKDHKPFIFHEELLDGVSDTTGLVQEMYLSEIEKVTLIPNAKIPSFLTFLEQFSNTFGMVFIDIKDPCQDSGLMNFARIISDYNFYDKCVITSANPDNLIRLKAIDAKLPLGTDGDFEDNVYLSVQEGFKYTLVRSVQLNKHLCYIAHAKGIKVYAYTPNSQQDMLECLRFDIDGIMTDNPELLRQLLSN
jgi:glycerophosphoryl diester phosphodiesterase